MIEYLKEYGISNFDFEYLMNNISQEDIQRLMLAESNVRENLLFYNKLGLKENLHKLILYRLDLVIMPLDQLKYLLSKIDKDLFVQLVNTNIKNLILLF
jgi:hypothetical protein